MALTLIELLIVVACLTVLAAILVPQLVRSKARSSKLGCINNVKQVGLAFRTWATDNNDRFPMEVSLSNGGTMELVDSGVVYPHFLVMSNELSTPKILACPNDPDRKEATTFQLIMPSPSPGVVPFSDDSNVSYFVGVDADPSQPGMLLSGDRDFAFDGVPVRPGLARVWSHSAAAWVKPLHDGGGNICFGDGSVQRLTASELPAVLLKSGTITNRLAVP